MAVAEGGGSRAFRHQRLMASLAKISAVASGDDDKHAAASKALELMRYQASDCCNHHALNLPVPCFTVG